MRKQYLEILDFILKLKKSKCLLGNSAVHERHTHQDLPKTSHLRMTADL